jgi:hypothetical protein
MYTKAQLHVMCFRPYVGRILFLNPFQKLLL